MLRDRVLCRRVAVPAAVLCVLVSAGCLRSGDASTATPTASGSSTGSPTTFATTVPTGAPTDAWMPVTVPDGAWETWRPVVTDVREASEADLAALERRARAAQDREFTVTVETFFGAGEFSHGRNHDRLRFGDESQPGIEVHVEPFRPGDTGKGAFGLTRRAAVLCVEKECIRVTGDEDPSGKPHLFDTIHDSALMQASILAGAQDDPMGIFHEGRKEGFAVGTARVASPMGTLDCAVGAETVGDLEALEGQVRDLSSTDERESVVACLDARGLVVMAADLAFPVIAYHSFRPGTAADLADYPFPVRAYGS